MKAPARQLLSWRAAVMMAALMWAVAACSPGPAPLSPEAPSSGSLASATADGQPLDVTATPVPLNPEDAAQRGVGRFMYAGGLELGAAASARFGGLSDLEVGSDGRMLAVTDEGRLVQARLLLDPGGRLSGVGDVTVVSLAGLDGGPLRDKSAADAEGIAVLPNGDRLVSFERDHRIWRYPASGGPPVPAPAPDAASGFPLNSGMEALTAFPNGGTGAYLVGSEGGAVWLCELEAGCRETAMGTFVPAGFGLTALAVSPDGVTIGLVARAFDVTRGVRAVVRLLGRGALDGAEGGLIDELTFAAPLTRDNFEGVALVSGVGGAIRLYLLSDNNYSATQHTYVLAFDWVPSLRT